MRVRSLIGAVVGFVVGAVVALNLVIFSGIESGYESGLGDVFAYSPVLGTATVTVLVAGPILGILVARRTSRRP